MQITGKTLVSLGYKPGKWFSRAIEHSNVNKLSGRSLVEYLDSVAPAEIKPHDSPIVFVDRYEGDEENIQAVRRILDGLMSAPTIIGGVILPDACPAGGVEMPVGTMAIAKNAIHPSMHSADICCSVMATNLGMVDPKRVMEMAFETTQFGPGKRKEHGGWSNLLYDNKSLVEKIEENYYTKDYMEKAAFHLGTQGDGNHFLFIGFSRNTGETMMVTHHGSRGFGSSVYKKGIDVANKFRRELSPGSPEKNAWIPYDEKEGVEYWEALQILREWTKLNHESIHNRILNKIKINYLDRFWNEHNFVFKKKDLFFHAKGATPMDGYFLPDAVDDRRLIPLNMSQPILVVEGAGALGFGPHGAGRNMSRAKHKQINSNKTVEQIFAEETKGLDVRFYSGNIDISELPSAYKDAEEIKRQIKHFGLGVVVDEIIPYGSIMAGGFIRK